MANKTAIAKREQELQQQNEQTAAVIREAIQQTNVRTTEALLASTAVGMMLRAQKEQGDHGEFEPWREQYLPEVHKATANRWMQLADAVCEQAGVSWDQKVGQLPMYEVMRLAPTDLRGKALAIRNRISQLVEGRSMKELTLQLRDKPADKPKAKKKATPGSKAAQLRMRANETANAIVADCETLRVDGLLNHVGKRELHRLEDALKQVLAMMKGVTG